MRSAYGAAVFSRHAVSRSTLGIFAVTALASVQAGGSAPTPIYRLYQQGFCLSPFTITLIFAVYPISLLLSLLTVGSLSDHVGRRPIMLAAMLLSGLSMAVFVIADGPAELILARILQGLATGAAASSLGAAILDVNPVSGALTTSVTAFTGTTIGALLSSVLVTYAPSPTRLVYALLFALFVLLVITTRWLPETGAPQPGGWKSLRPHIELPAHVRNSFWMVSPVNVAGWALDGFYLSLMPTLFRAATGVTSAMLGGTVIASLSLSGAAAIWALRSALARTVLLRGATALAVGVAITLAGVHLSGVPLLAVGTVIAGIGFGASFFGAARTILPQARPHERAGVLSAFYVESYLAFSVPAVVIALLTPSLGLQRCTYIYGGVIMVLAAASFAATVCRAPTSLPSPAV